METTLPTDALIYDIETATFGASFQELEKHKLRFFGAYSYADKKYYLYTHKEKDKIRQLIAKHKFLIGFNNKKYDDIILAQEGINLHYKTIIDLKKIIEERQSSIKWKNSILTYHLNALSLDNITKTLNLVNAESGKGDLDYKVLYKEEFTKEEMNDITKYTLRDIEVTKKLWEWTFNWFDSWGHLLTQKDRNNLVHISCSPSVYSYKVICKKAGLKETYSNIKMSNQHTVGGYVAYPAIKELEGNIFCMDFASLYPHITIQCNIFGRLKNNENKIEQGWKGFGCKGLYDSSNQHKISKAIQEMYIERRELKKAGDPREYGLKIAMNTIYGLLRSSLFKSVYDDVAGNDVCIIGQNWIKLARQKFKDAGYFVFYTDTDSVYLEDKSNNKEKLLEVTKSIIDEIKKDVPFPSKTFDMDIDFEINYISFFKGGKKNIEDEKELDEEDKKNKSLQLLKKNYLFSYKKGDNYNIYLKNLGITKRSNTPLSKKIFWEKIVPFILETHSTKISNNQIQEWVKEYLENDISLFTRRFVIKNRNSYKVEGCLQVQIYDYVPKEKEHNLGIGTYFLVPNKKFGVGKGFKKYCLLEEYQKYLNYDDLYLDVVMKELSYFNENYIPMKTSNRKEKVLKMEEKYQQKELW